VNNPHTGNADHLSALRAAGVVAVLRAPTAEKALLTVEALLAGGVTGIEITYSTPDATQVIAELKRRHGDALYLGAGTVLTARQAGDAVHAGAQFLVCPGIDAPLGRAMLETGAAVYAGALTPTEVMAVVRIGAHAVKIFPASLGGPAYLKALRGPFPDVHLMPTGGVNAHNIGAWLTAGAVAVGAGSDLCSPTAMADNRWDVIEESARSFRAAFTASTKASAAA
jgi:2-dehydro-3-deoxyphosphogluconate aldolase/(4S)-4-hydroxy-2-oxoglutarate aldolase